MKPLAYGYVRFDGAVHDDQLCAMEQALRDFAECEGYSCAEILHEGMSGDQRAFIELIEVLKEQEVHHVLTPTIYHLAAHPLLRQTMLLQLAEAGAHVIPVCDSVEGMPNARNDSTENQLRHI